jgi:hypothetical protein
MIEAPFHPRPAARHGTPGPHRAATADDMSRSAALGALTQLLNDTRTGTGLAGALLTAAAPSVAVTGMAWSRSLQAGASVCCLVLLVPVLLTWVRAGVLLALAGRPVTGALAELRRHTGAPVQPGAPWVPGGMSQATAFDLGRWHTQSLVAAASLRQTRTQLALRWAMLAAGACCVWTAVVFALSSLG